MKSRAQGLIAGVLIGATLTGGFVYATGTRNIEVLYDNIKVYKDNALCELKDANGTIVEPFIYNGTTYMPVRATANLAGMNVTWDDATKSVYLWDEIPHDETFLMDVCPPYEMSNNTISFISSEGEYFYMGGSKYSNGFTFNFSEQHALINLNSKYSNMNLTIGHVDGSPMYDHTVTFIADGKVIKEIDVSADGLPQDISIPLNNVKQLKIINREPNSGSTVGFGNIMVR